MARPSRRPGLTTRSGSERRPPGRRSRASRGIPSWSCPWPSLPTADSSPRQAWTTAKVWDIPGGGPARTLTGQAAAVAALAVKPDGKEAAVAAGRSVRIWDLAKSASIEELEGFAREVSSVAWRQDGAQIAAGDRSHTIRLWKAVRSGSLCGRRCLMLLLTCLFENPMSRRMVAEYARLHLLMPTTAGAGCFPPAIAPRAWQSLPHALAQLGRCRYLAQQREQRIHLDQLADCHHLPLHVVEQLLVGNLLRLTCLVRRQVGAHDLQRVVHQQAERHLKRKYSVNPYLIEHNLININQLWRRSISALWMMVRRNRKEINELRLESTG